MKIWPVRDRSGWGGYFELCVLALEWAVGFCVVQEAGGQRFPLQHCGTFSKGIVVLQWNGVHYRVSDVLVLGRPRSEQSWSDQLW